MLGRILSLVAALLLASASASAYVPERSIASPELRVSGPKTASRDFAQAAEPAAKGKAAANNCRVWEIWSPPQSLTSSMGFTGYYADAESGDYYAQQRYYRQGVGRFLSIDPWEGDTSNPITLNKYLYANGNPLIYIDPDGRIAYLSDWESYTDETVAGYDRDIDRAVADGASGRAFALGVGKGFAALGNLVVSGLNTTSNLLARNIYDGATYEQAQREIAANELAMANAMEATHRTAMVIQEDPGGAVRAVHGAAVGFTVDVAMGDPRAMAGLGEFTGQLVVPAGTAKGLKVAGESVDTARAAMRMGDGFVDAGMVDDLATMSRGAGRHSGIDAVDAHLPGGQLRDVGTGRFVADPMRETRSTPVTSNRNRRDTQEPTIFYRIDVDGQGRKVGISSVPANASGDYMRPRSQVRALEDLYGEDARVRYRVQREFEDRASALDYERNFLERFKRLYGQYPGEGLPGGNRTNR